ncbi:DUF1853 family protein [Bizionia myxarmorum]|uniref:DUF1853 family protein n=1 Tax=Bizionia myxarmorum TaxID=291186 RepID=A0A5D0R6Z4_9FLAO|nr:DUF1853 family protein [Bizionia myxarmorum]TYB76324.1 DUF1853 family protein [Bizionia myxarmorum]
MLSESENIQRQYQGYKRTPNLWVGDSIFGISQLNIIGDSQESFIRNIPANIRLGKRVEQFVFNELEHDEAISILVENVQIQEEKKTVGELDAIISYHGKPIHLEIIYKFYVYDETVGTSELDHFIGPNRKDSLVEKLDKLKNKQLPLLYKVPTKYLLEDLNLKSENMLQKVYFKAQLFMPFDKQIILNDLNPECISGYYLRKDDLKQFEACSFYFPTKPNWLQDPHSSVNWINYEIAQVSFNQIQSEKYAACCWIKNENNKLEKCFIVWW